MRFLSQYPQIYRMLRPVLFKIDPEQAHHLAILMLSKWYAPRFDNFVDRRLRVTVAGIDFPNPIGLAAGFDKNAEAIGEFLGLGFGAVEVGTITPKPQEGNPKPRLFRIPEAEAVINRFGFNNDGIDVCLQRLIAYRDATNIKSLGVVGVNIGKNKDSVDAVADYVAGVRAFSPYADYLAVNVSSPNTPGLRDLQGEPLADLLARVMEANAASGKKPVFVKIAPDLTMQQLEDIARVVLDSGVSGVIVSNTTVSRPESVPAEVAKEAGGLSGKPLFELSTRVLSDMYRLTGGKLPLIGVGGVATAEDAYRKIRAGASLVQIYSALVYEGPFMVPKLNKDLLDLVARDRLASVADAVGADVK